MTKLKSQEPNEKHRQCHGAIIDAMKKFDLTPEELLAVAATVVGQLIAMQDQRHMTLEAAHELVRANIEQGNRMAVEAINAAGGKPN